jgi:hypothetical protein
LNRFGRAYIGPRPTAFTTGDDLSGEITVQLQSEQLHLLGDLANRQKLATVIAEAAGLSVVDTSRIPGPLAHQA